MEIKLEDIQGLKGECQVYRQNADVFMQRKQAILKAVNDVIERNPKLVMMGGILNFTYRIT